MTNYQHFFYVLVFGFWGLHTKAMTLDLAKEPPSPRPSFTPRLKLKDTAGQVDISTCDNR